MIQEIASAALATVSFAVLLNVRRRDLLVAMIGGGLGWTAYSGIDYLTHSTVMATVVAAMSIGIYSEIAGRVLRRPANIYTICAIIPLVPGGGMYYTMLYAIQRNIHSASVTGLNTIITAGAIAAGLLLSSLLARRVRYIIDLPRQFHIGDSEENTAP